MADEAIKTVAGEITKIAVEHGYNGVAPKTITAAIDALADTLAGSDVDSGNTVAQAVRALAPYIGSGGGGGIEMEELLNETLTTEEVEGFNQATFTSHRRVDYKEIVVTIDGTNYTCQMQLGYDRPVYGATYSMDNGYDFTDYPFSFASGGDDGNTIYFKDPGTHDVIVSAKKGALGMSAPVIVDVIGMSQFSMETSVSVSLTPFDISGDDLNAIYDTAYFNEDVSFGYSLSDPDNCPSMASGIYVFFVLTVQSPGYDPTDMEVYVNPFGDPQLVTEGYEYRYFENTHDNISELLITAKVPYSGIKFKF